MTEETPPAHDGIGVLLVEGDPAVRRARQIMLLSEQYDVRSYATGAAVLADPRSRAVPCIVVDTEGSPGAGIDVVEALRASGWRGTAILLDGSMPSTALLRAAERHGDKVLDRATGDGALLSAIAASLGGDRSGRPACRCARDGTEKCPS